ncbi:terpene cyclase/mutase family protein [Stieleria sp. JC731]|uniref:prenyltransferase/squalene oxidase repeat-containing protein n=1 Tax=Pirellulaceae TaxID=2691357 RepID=UPI001E31B860|nr:prenyltransferase/squalene oxidase repeat-containing protein [Stieleria sp. JC731]MCC9604179.1 terpene cyclase/mutase family protein [Stieleria sp. JC731]
MLSYLQSLTLRLAAGASQLDPAIRDHHAQWLISQQRDDGGFAGREGESDPYYTAFALRALWIVDALSEPIGHRAALFLRSRLNRRESVVDLISLIFAAAICEMSVGAQVLQDDDATWADNVAGLLESLRTDDGGFAKSPEGRAGSTYQTFLSVLCLELMGRQPIAPESIRAFIDSQAHQDGGYLEIRAAKRPGVNPTAAAIGTLKTLDQLGSVDTKATAEFLADMQSDEGGFTANTRIPFADLLSSCTAMITLEDLDAIDMIDRNAVRRYAQSMQMPSGGFVGFQLDQTADVEYTFYGLAALAMCESV